MNCPRCGSRVFRAWDTDYANCLNCGDVFVGQVPDLSPPREHVGPRMKEWTAPSACMDCGVPIEKKAKRCRSCNMRWRRMGERKRVLPAQR